MVMKNICVHCKQFPLILAYAVTIHKCQGLSLDCAIIDLSAEVFSDGMAYSVDDFDHPLPLPKRRKKDKGKAVKSRYISY